MKNLLFAAFVLLSCLFIACQSNDPNHQLEQQKHEEIMAVHDEVMPKMGDINRLSRELKKVADSASGHDEATKASASQAVQQLEKADEAMMGWMEAYQTPSKMRNNIKHEDIMNYLEKEKQKIDMVKTMMLESIENAGNVLARVPETE